VLRSGATAIVIAWSMRVIGLVSVIVLARMLTPADFGIVALAMATLAMADVFSALGLKQALLRVREPEREHYDTVWTLQLGVLVFLALIVAALGPVVAWFYAEPALAIVIPVLATRFVFFGLANIGVLDFERELEFGRDLKFRVFVRLTSFFVTVGAALILLNYWALVIGAVFQGVVHCLASYWVHPYRPRFSLARRAEMLGVSVWMFLASFAQVLHVEIQRVVVGRVAGFGVLGFYSVSKGLSSIFTEEIATALNRVTFVTTARTGEALGARPERLAAMLGAYGLIAAPLGIGLAATSGDAVMVLLGAQWGEAAPFLELIAPAAALYAVFKLIVSSLQASGKARLAASLSSAATIGVIAGIGIALMRGGGAIEVAAAVLAVNALVLVGAIALLAIEERASFANLMLAAGRPFAAASLMYLALGALPPIAAPPFFALVADAAIGAVIYAASAAALWLASARPAGAEALMLAFVRQAIVRPSAQTSDM